MDGHNFYRILYLHGTLGCSFKEIDNDIGYLILLDIKDMKRSYI